MLQYKDTQCYAKVQGYTMWCCSQGNTMWCCSTRIHKVMLQYKITQRDAVVQGYTTCFCRTRKKIQCCRAGIHTVMLQYKVTQCGTAVQEPLMWCCSKGHTMWCCSTNISYFKYFNINTVIHFCTPLVLTPDILTTVFALQLGSYRHNARHTCSFQLSKWHYVEKHNNPEWRLRWWRNVWHNRQDDFDDVWTNTVLRCIIRRRNTSQRNNAMPVSVYLQNQSVYPMHTHGTC
jgi:hypothetical protein